MSNENHPIKDVVNELIINDKLPGLVSIQATALILDINNLYKRAKNNGFRIDYGKLKTIFGSRCDVKKMIAYSAVDRNDPSVSDWLSYMTKRQYQVYTKDLNRYINHEGNPVVKGNMDIEITIGALSLPNTINHVILGTCDEDFVPLVNTLKSIADMKVSVLGIHNPKTKGMSDSLMKAADNFYNLFDLVEFISYKG